MSTVSIAGCGNQASGLYAAFSFDRIKTNQIQGDMFEYRKVVRRVFCARAHLVVVEGDVHGPVQPVFNAPVGPDSVAEASGVGCQTADIETLLDGCFSLDKALALKARKKFRYDPIIMRSEH